MKILYSLYSSWKGIPPVFIDGTIVVLIAFLTFWETAVGGDEAAKYISAEAIFWAKHLIGSMAIVFVTLQSFRSKVFTEHQQKKEKQNEIETAFLGKPPTS